MLDVESVVQWSILTIQGYSTAQLRGLHEGRLWNQPDDSHWLYSKYTRYSSHLATTRPSVITVCFMCSTNRPPMGSLTFHLHCTTTILTKWVESLAKLGGEAFFVPWNIAHVDSHIPGGLGMRLGKGLAYQIQEMRLLKISGSTTECHNYWWYNVELGVMPCVCSMYYKCTSRADHVCT